MTRPAWRSALIRGAVMHARTDEQARRTFRYPVYVASLDLDELPAIDRALRLFSYGGRNLFALHDADYEAAVGPRGLRGALADLLAANGLPAPHTTRLVTNLRVAGHVFNPVSFFLNYDAAGALASVIAEVNNTYGGRRRYVLGPAQRIDGGPGGEPAHQPRSEPSREHDRGARQRARRPGLVGFRHVRELFVSPFLHGPASYDFWFDAPLDGDRLAITMHVDRPAGLASERAAASLAPASAAGGGHERIFVAELAGTRQPISDRALAATAVRYPLMTVQVLGLIHWQAIKLRLRGVPYFRPTADHRPRPFATATLANSTPPDTDIAEIVIQPRSSHASAAHPSRGVK